MESFDLIKAVNDADVILISIGDEFDRKKLISDRHKKFLDDARLSGEFHLIPEINHIFNSAKEDDSKNISFDERVNLCLQKLNKILSDKNYFIVSTSTNDSVSDINWKEGRIVSPCGGYSHFQYALPTEDSEIIKVNNDIHKRINEAISNDCEIGVLKEICGSELVFNNVYAEQYDEKGYLADWQAYTKWLQLTLNKKLLVLELGVGLQFPSVTRWPFEKIAYYNKKATFVRVNETLYQLPENLSDKGISVNKNAIDWLSLVC